MNPNKRARTTSVVVYPGGRSVTTPAKRARVSAQSTPARAYLPPRNLAVPETKYFDVGISNTQTWAGTDWSATEIPCDNYVNSSGTAAAYTDSALIPTANGSGYGQVTGNKYSIKKIRVRGEFYSTRLETQTTVDYHHTVRMMLIQDTQPNGAQAQGEDIMQDLGAAGENLFSFMRVASNLGRFRILKDKFVVLQPATSSNNAAAATISTVGNASLFKFQFVPKTPIQVSIKSGNATPTVAGLVNQNIFLLVASNYAGLAASLSINAASRCYYTEP